MIIRPTTVIERGGGVGRGKDEIMFRAAPIRNILSSLYTVPTQRVVGEPADDPTRYDAWIALPGASREAFLSFARTAACAGLHVTVEKESRDTEVYVLTAPNGEPPGRVKEEFGLVGGITGGDKGLLRLRAPFIGLSSILERPLGAPVIDQTGIQGVFDIRLTYEEGSKDSLVQAVEKLGLKLTKARRPIEYLIVKKAQ